MPGTTGGRLLHRTGRDARRVVMVAALVGLTLAGCGPDGGPGPSPSPSPGPSATAVAMPDHPAGLAAGWVLGTLETDASPTVDDVEDRVSDQVLAELPAADLLSTLAELRAQGPWVPTSVDGGPDAVTVHLDGPRQDLRMQVSVDGDGRVTGLWFAPPPPPRDPATSWSDLVDEVTASQASTSLYVARVVDGSCVPVEPTPAGTAAGHSLPIGSIVKLYVLGAVVDAVGRGDLAWDTEITVTDALRSLPSGRLQDEPDGTVVTVEQAARDMIAISDNTATDLLVDAVGRDRVERALVDLGHSDPARNTPLATTRELFHLGWGEDGDWRRRWHEADEAGRRAILAALPDGPPPLEALASTPVWTSDVDWFATAADLCAAHVALAERALTPHGAVVREILSANPGLEVDGAWDHVAFKGGSSVGTMAGAWYAEPAGGGEPVVVVLQTAARTAQAAVPAETMVAVASDALRLAAD